LDAQEKERWPTRTCAEWHIACDAVFRVLKFISYRAASQYILNRERREENTLKLI
jgi:hypothetical protein